MTYHNPWLGLASYEETKGAENDHQFCGRDEETLDVVRLIDNNLFITLYGSSGIGKTSLLRAGVIPILRRKDYFPLYVRLSQEPKEISYAEAIVQKLQNSGPTQESGTTTKHPEGNNRLYLWNYFATTRFYNEGREVYPVIILDQFEEVFREGDKAKAELLLKQIYLLLNDELEMPDEAGYSADTNYRFVASIREDFLFVLEDSIDANSLDLYKNNRYRLRPMKPDNAREVVLIPGKDCIEESEKEAIAKRIMDLATRPQSDAIDTLLLSLVCAGTYDKKAGQKIALDDLSIWKNNPMEVYYQEAVKGLSADQVRYIQQHLILEDGSRKRIDSKEVKTALGENTYQQLTQGKNRLFALGDKGQVELLHDQLGMAIYEERKAFEERERKKKFRRRISVIGIIVLAIAGIFWFQNAKLKQQRWKMLESQSRFVSEKMEPLVKEDSFLAKLLAINVLPNNVKHPNRPYIPEAERVLRNATLFSSMVLNKYNQLGIQDFQYTTDGKHILSSSKEGIRIWDMEKGSCSRFIPYKNYGKLWIINPDQGIAALADTVIKLIDIETGTDIKEIKTNGSYIEQIICCQNGSKIAALDGEWLINVIDVESGIAKAEFKRGYDNVFNPDGRLMISINCLIKKYDEKDHEWNNKYLDGILKRDSLDNLIARFGDSEIIIIELETGCIVNKIKTSTNLRKVACSPDGSTIAALDYDGLIHIIDLNSGTEENVYRCGDYYDFSPNGKSLAYFDNKEGVLKICDVYSGRILHTYEMKYLNKRTIDFGEFYDVGDYAVYGVSFSPDGKQVTVSSGDLYVIGIEEPYLATIDGNCSVKTIHNSFSCNGKYIVSAKDKDVMVWNAKTKQCIRLLKGHKENVGAVAISPDGNYVVSTDHLDLLLWNAHNGECINRINKQNLIYLCAIFSPDSKKITMISMDTTNSDNNVGIIDVETGEITILDKELFIPQYASYSPDGKKLAFTSAMNYFNVIDMEKDSVTPFGIEYFNWYNTVEFSHNGKRIVSTASNNNNVQIWDVKEGKRIQVLKGHTRTVNYAEFSPDDKFIVSSSSDNTIRVWDIDSGCCIYVIHMDGIGWGGVFTPDGKQIMAQVSDSLLFFGFPPLQDLIDQTRERFKDRPLTPEERRMYYLE